MQNKPSFILIYFVDVLYGSIDCWSSITWISLVYGVCYNCSCSYVFVMVYVWPLSPSSYEVAIITIVITNGVVRKTSTTIA
jgi:hypothetical protein